MFLHKTQTKAFGNVGGLLFGLILLSLSGSANAAFIGLNWNMGNMVGQTHNAVLSQITSGSLSVWSGASADQPDALFNNGSDIKPLSVANNILNPETGPLTTGLLTTGPLTTGPLTTGPLTMVTGPLSTGTLVRESRSVPEPSSLLLMGIGLAALGFVRRRK